MSVELGCWSVELACLSVGLAGIYLTEIPALDYDRHLFQERQVRSVTANTRADAREFPQVAGEQRLRVSTQEYPMDEAGRVNGAAILVN